ncbi:MAG: nucleoside triphosphate pyrophosphohydrolase [Pseudomonadota bacterium]
MSQVFPSIDKEQASRLFIDFLTTVSALRHPVHGCPWDLEQTHESLARFMLEEAYEASELLALGASSKELCSELGDVLLQVVLNSQLAMEKGGFSIVEVLSAIDSKMKRRHPHVFGTEDDKKIKDLKSIKDNWQAIKSQENAGNPQSGSQNSPKKSPGIFKQNKIDRVFPAALKAHKIGEIAGRIQFDWKDPFDVLAKLESEVLELRQAMEQKRDAAGHGDQIFDELGDIFFTANQLARHLGTNGETAADRGNTKFLKRFELLESLAESQGLDIQTLTAASLEKLWLQAKGLS